MVADNSRCASSGNISSMGNVRSITRPIVDICSSDSADRSYRLYALCLVSTFGHEELEMDSDNIVPNRQVIEKLALQQTEVWRATCLLYLL